MVDPFESPMFLIAQTKENLADFEMLCAPVFQGNCSSSVVDIDPESGNKTFKVKFTKRIPGKARHIAASAISDLRHALDQAAVASVKTITGVNPEKLYFPFATTPNDLAGRLRDRFPDEIHPTFSSFETYPTGEGHVGGNDLLAAFSKSTGPNKHQITCKVGGRVTEIRSDSICGRGGVVYMAMPPQWDIDSNELIIGTTAPTGHIDYNFDMSFYVALSEAGELNGSPALPILRDITAAVEQIVLAIRTDTQCIVGCKF